MAKIKLLTDEGLRQLMQLINARLSKKVDAVPGKHMVETELYYTLGKTTEVVKKLFPDAKSWVQKVNAYQDMLALLATKEYLPVVNDLTTGGADKALSAEQGKILFQSVDSGKGVVANAIIGKGVTGVSKDSTFQELATAIENISGGGGSFELEYVPQTTDDEPMIYNSTIQTFLRNNRSRIVIFPNVFRRLSGSGQNMFAECSALRIVPGIDMSHITTARIMFVGAPNLEYVGALKTSNKLTDVSEMFRGCAKLKFVPKFDISGVTNFSGIFKGCSSLDIAKMRAAGWPEEYLQTAPNYSRP